MFSFYKRLFPGNDPAVRRTIGNLLQCGMVKMVMRHKNQIRRRLISITGVRIDINHFFLGCDDPDTGMSHVKQPCACRSRAVLLGFCLLFFCGRRRLHIIAFILARLAFSPTQEENVSSRHIDVKYCLRFWLHLAKNLTAPSAHVEILNRLLQ